MSRPNFEPLETPKGWCVSIPPSMNASGKRKRRFFADRKEAARFAGSLRRKNAEGERGGLIPLALATQAAEAERILEGTGVSIVDAARQVAARFAAAGHQETFRQRYDRVVAEREMHWRPRYAVDMAKVPQWVGDSLMAMQCALVTPDVLKAALKANGAAAASTLAARYSRASSILLAKPPKPRRVAEIHLMTPKQCAAMIRACVGPEELRAVALLLFAGIRPDSESGEITRLDWEAVGEREIYVSAAVSKTGSDRHIPITPRLARLIKGHPASGPVVPAWWKKRIQRLRASAGVAGLQDVTRHTFASNFLAAFGEADAKQAMGHTANSATIFRHYRRAVTSAAGRKFFGAHPARPQAVDQSPSGSSSGTGPRRA
jgi:integrase